jgi:hypothetical protein
VHPLAAIAAHTNPANATIANLFFILSPGPEQDLTRAAPRVKRAQVHLALTAADTQV